jgi:hypothetical protein
MHEKLVKFELDLNTTKPQQALQKDQDISQ